MASKHFILKPREQNSFELGDQPIKISLDKNNTFVIKALSQWQGPFSQKDKSLTERYYCFDSQRYDENVPISSARKLIGEDEQLVLGSIRNQLYFGSDQKYSSLSPEHLVIMKSGNIINLENKSNHKISVEIG